MARSRLSGVALGPTAPSTATQPGPAPRARSTFSGGLAGGVQQLGPRGYLYLLVLLEVGAIASLRHVFRDHHGG